MFQDNQPEQPTQPENMQQVTPEQAPTPEQPTPEQAPASQPEQAKSPAPQQPSKPATIPEKTTQDERMWAAIGYVAFLGIVSLAMKPKSEFCKHHAAQGLTIFILWFVSLILLAMPSFIGAIGGILLLGATGLAVFGIVKAIGSYKLEIPVLSSIAEKIPTNSIIGSITGKTPEVKTPQEGQPAEEKQAPTTPPQSQPQEPIQGEQDGTQKPPTTPPQA